MKTRIEILLGALALVAVLCCLVFAGGRPGSAWGALPGAGAAPTGHAGH